MFIGCRMRREDGSAAHGASGRTNKQPELMPGCALLMTAPKFLYPLIF